MCYDVIITAKYHDSLILTCNRFSYILQFFKRQVDCNNTLRITQFFCKCYYHLTGPCIKIRVNYSHHTHMGSCLYIPRPLKRIIVIIRNPSVTIKIFTVNISVKSCRCLGKYALNRFGLSYEKIKYFSR